MSIETFNFDGMADVRVVVRDGDPWFAASDVTGPLGFRNANDAVKGLDEDEREVIYSDRVFAGQPENELFTSQTGNLRQKTTLVNESGLYSLILRSNKPEAKRFKRWVTAEVLPTIRKTGGAYVAPGSQAEYDLNDPDTVLDKLAETVQLAKDERAKRLETEQANEQLEARAKADAPKVKVADEFFDSEGLMGLRECARSFSIPQTTFTGLLRQWDWIDKHGTAAKSEPVKRGYLTNKVHLHKGGQSVYSKITRKGVDRISKKISDMAN